MTPTKVELFFVLSALTIWESPLVVALVTAVVAIIPAYLIFRSTSQRDKDITRAERASQQTTSRRQVIEGLDKIIKRQDIEIKRLYARVDQLEERIAELETRRSA